MNNLQTNCDVVVVGGGLAGLTAARELQKSGLQVTLIEKSNAVGGRVKSVSLGGQVVETGGGFLSSFYDATLRLVEELSLSKDLVHTSQTANIARATVQPIWPLGRLISANGLSLGAKLRLGLIILPLARHWRNLDIADLTKAVDLDRATAEAYLRRLVGSESLQFFFAPLLRGLLYWDTNSTSYPVVLAILKAFVATGGSLRMRQGLNRLPRSLASGLSVHLGTKALGIQSDGPDRYIIRASQPDGNHTYIARGVICAATADGAAPLVRDVDPRYADYLNDVSYSATALLTFAVPSSAVDYPKGSILFPKPDVDDIAALNPVVDLDGSGTSGQLVNIYLSHEGFTRYEDQDDEQLASTVLSRIDQILGPLTWLSSARLLNVQRWHRALPEFDVGHIRRTTQFVESARSNGRIMFAGDYIGGPYIDGAVRSGATAAADLRNSL